MFTLCANLKSQFLIYSECKDKALGVPVVLCILFRRSLKGHLKMILLKGVLCMTSSFLHCIGLTNNTYMNS